jgi:hypothetical protein
MYCAVLALCINHAVLAQEQRRNTIWDGFTGFFSPDWKKDFSATVGVKIWMNTWRRDSFFTSTPSLTFNQDTTITFADGTAITFPSDTTISAFANNPGPVAETSDTKVTPNPTYSVRYKWLVFSGSYYSDTDFDFDPVQRQQSISLNGANVLDFTLTDNTSAERREWDVEGGIFVHPNIVILGGYKRICQKINFTTTVVSNPPDISNLENFISVNDAPSKFSSDLTIEGPIIGMAGSVPIAYGLGVYVGYAHGFLEVDITDVDLTTNQIFGQATNLDASYDVAELGFTYTPKMDFLPPHLPLSAATIYAGYRYQAFETDAASPNTAERSDTTRGFVVGLNLTF